MSLEPIKSVVICPVFDAFWNSYYLQGLRNVLVDLADVGERDLRVADPAVRTGISRDGGGQTPTGCKCRLELYLFAPQRGRNRALTRSFRDPGAT